MRLKPYFSSSSKVWDDIIWVYGLEDLGYSGWEISGDGNYRLDQPDSLIRILEVLESTGLLATVHAPFGDLNLASLNQQIWDESLNQICNCISAASNLTDIVTIHPGYLSPIGKLMPEKAWQVQREALVRIGRHASEHSVTACLENMIGIKEFLGRYPEELIGLTSDIEGIGMTFDIGHANTVGKVPEFLSNITKADHLHIHDNHGLSDSHLPLGNGTINWENVGRVVASDYHGAVVVEGRSLEEAEESLRVFRRYFT